MNPDDQNPQQPTPPAADPAIPVAPVEPPPAATPAPNAEEDQLLSQIHNLEEEKTEVATDATMIDKREEEGKELETEAQNMPEPPPQDGMPSQQGTAIPSNQPAQPAQPTDPATPSDNTQQ